MVTVTTNGVTVLDGKLAVSDGIVYLLTPCCQASGKGMQSGVGCRACYRPVDSVYGWGALVSDQSARADCVASLMQAYGSELTESYARLLTERAWARGAEA
jgi:hypothetical protein